MKGNRFTTLKCIYQPPPPWGTPINFGWVRATLSFNSCPFLRLRQMKMDTRFKAQAQIMTPYSRGKQKLKVNGKTQTFIKSFRNTLRTTAV